MAKPFLKWAGGKSQLLKQFEQFYPTELRQGKIFTYVEPFLGGGAVFFDVCEKYKIQQAFLSDINQELILAYRVIQVAPEALIAHLAAIDENFSGLEPDSRKKFYYTTRENYNLTRSTINFDEFSDELISRAAQIIFLNKTCFNGLFRENKKGQFNVPFGRYKNPKILDARNIREVSQMLQCATIACTGFESTEKYIDANTFVYFDPPYRPLNQTSNFTTYFRNKFTEADQILLSEFFNNLAEKYRAKLMLSNSDPQNCAPDDCFFEMHYPRFHMNRISARRMINRDAGKRGNISELVITNYPIE